MMLLTVTRKISLLLKAFVLSVICAGEVLVMGMATDQNMSGELMLKRDKACY